MNSLAVASSLPLTSNTKPSTLLRLQHKPEFSVSFPAIRSQARDASEKSILPSLSRASTTAIKSVPSTKLPATDPKQTVEHIVLFKMKEGTDEEIVVDALNSLRCLPGVLYLSAGFVHGIHSSPLDFNIFLHSRHATKEHLDIYMGHRLKYAFSMTYTEADYLDYIIIDYVHDHDEALDHPELGNAVRSTFFKLKDGWGEAEKNRAFQVVSEALQGSIDQQTFGENFEGTTYDPAHKGYDLGTLALFPSIEKLQELGSPEEFAEKLKNKLSDALDESVTVFVVDFVIDKVFDGNPENIWNGSMINTSNLLKGF